ncbi:hypothetical protein [Nocardioides abyssi]|uniref:Uncharacterized protein n=1 Tax=Nocardioides abyssi TaxID=3058370 RepID=A0ABT8EY30_9ACTN|nr:hypothetical protein [Nocardioides abyssi]MDN4162974.1 hypothetical protein [Nocardioides abyssi]
MALPETLEGINGTDDGPHQRGGLWSRRAVIALLALVVAAGLAGVLGVRTTTSEGTTGDWHLEVLHPQVARAGLDAPWEVRVRHDGGFGPEVEIAVTGAYFDIFETQGFHPEPTEATRDGETLHLTFAAPDTDELVVRYDAYIQPASQQGASGEVSVLERGAPVVSVPIRTRLLP